MSILGDPGAVSGAEGKSIRAKKNKNSAKKTQERSDPLTSPGSPWMRSV